MYQLCRPLLISRLLYQLCISRYHVSVDVSVAVSVDVSVDVSVGVPVAVSVDVSVLRCISRCMGPFKCYVTLEGVGGCMPKRYEALRGGGGGYVSVT